MTVDSLELKCHLFILLNTLCKMLFEMREKNGTQSAKYANVEKRRIF